MGRYSRQIYASSPHAIGLHWQEEEDEMILE